MGRVPSSWFQATRYPTACTASQSASGPWGHRSPQSGAFEQATLRYFDRGAKQYRPIAVEEQAEAPPLNGDIALDQDRRPKLHLHAVLGKRDGAVMGGHRETGRVRPILEAMITKTPSRVRRVHDKETGLPR